MYWNSNPIEHEINQLQNPTLVTIKIKAIIPTITRNVLTLY